VNSDAGPGHLPLADHHCHGVVRGDLDRAGFEALMSEGGSPPAGMTNFDTPVGLAIRRHCAPVLDLAPHASPEDYLRRRAELGTTQVTRRFLQAAGITEMLIDTGLRPEMLLDPAAMAQASGGDAREIVRLETVAERLAGEGVEPGEFAAAYRAALARAVASSGAAGLKSIAAYRVGLDFDPRPPGAAEVTAAAAAWLAGPAGPAGQRRLADPVLTRALLWAAVEYGLPIQFHIGYGDRDIRLHRSDPALLTDFLHLVDGRVPVMLLHTYPYQRQAGYLAAVYPNVYLDVGLALSYVGPARAGEVLAEALELAPFTKLLFSTDAFGLPELYYLGAQVFRQALDRLLGERVRSGEWAAGDAGRIAHMVCAGNARRVYRLGAGAA
jgi:predicted TIM-barrel fold metal-dependent hydrolase